MKLGFSTGILCLAATTALAAPENLPEPATAEMFPKIDIQQAMLGRSLFFDPILAGNENIACSTCHHPSLGTSDGMSLSIGEGGVGLGPDRRLGAGEHVYARIPRNAPALWNRGSTDFRTMFHDGRLQIDATRPEGILMPAARDLERPVMSPLAAQALLPITSPDEMAGQHEENPTAALVEKMRFMGDDGAWSAIAAKVETVPEYRAAFDWIIGPDEPLHITDIANALAAFMTFEFRSTDAPFDRYLRGDETAITGLAAEGMELFYGDAGCSGCHAGTFQSDHQFHAIGMPQLGPGKAQVADRAYADIGRMAVTGDPADAYKFRTPSLRNVTRTAPYGHAGAYATLEATIRHHMNPKDSLAAYRIDQALLHAVTTDHPDTEAMDDPEEMARIAAAIEFEGVNITEDQIPALIAFLGTLEDPVALAGRLGVPDRVPSGLKMDEVRPPALATAPTPPRATPSPARVFRAFAQSGEVPIPDRGPVRPADISRTELVRVDREITALLSR
ncbi:cytochrome c peroxidase [Maritimibacter sp. UBA3975]|uniref:cytochrome-c peroxidase n=1 Tax=Maritimibacter sp. UBA3975 TaxID=1946833 RepID=UPI000C0A0094|nr:cytochrome c peroxidase [Maritimibacter sp. UBA3975]MAM61250.1 cytochrome-c peroxidase [Maritimibacter sp.]